MMESTEPEEDQQRAAKHKEEDKKFCPILYAKSSLTFCLGKRCALWVDIIKDGANPFYYGEYHGCGLIVNLPYIIKKKKL